MSEAPLLPLDYSQPRSSRRERAEVYRAIEILRRGGHAVYRAGEDHLVDGKIASTPQILSMARAET